jgi:rubredoxin
MRSPLRCLDPGPVHARRAARVRRLPADDSSACRTGRRTQLGTTPHGVSARPDRPVRASPSYDADPGRSGLAPAPTTAGALTTPRGAVEKAAFEPTTGAASASKLGHVPMHECPQCGLRQYASTSYVARVECVVCGFRLAAAKPLPSRPWPAPSARRGGHGSFHGDRPIAKSGD